MKQNSDKKHTRLSPLTHKKKHMKKKFESRNDKKHTRLSPLTRKKKHMKKNSK
jgi:hypothetical protein